MVTAYIGVGTNVGDMRGNLRVAFEQLRTMPGVVVCRVASVYRSEPQGLVDQDWFLNTVVEVNTSLSAQGLLTALQSVETLMGRIRTIRWGPRVIDLDILLYGEETIDCPGLIVPHPRLLERAFVVVPLAELVPDLKVALNLTAFELAGRLSREQAVEKVEKMGDDGYDGFADWD